MSKEDELFKRRAIALFKLQISAAKARLRLYKGIAICEEYEKEQILHFETHIEVLELLTPEKK